jgi:hypothetical protein
MYQLNQSLSNLTFNLTDLRDPGVSQEFKVILFINLDKTSHIS